MGDKDYKGLKSSVDNATLHEVSLFSIFLIASMQCASDLKKDFVVVVVFILDNELLSKFSQNWIMLRLEKITQYRFFIPDYS